MWICFSEGFVSIVSKHDSDELLVRARQKRHLAAFLGDAEKAHPIQRTPGRDYLFRAVLPRDVAADLIGQRVLEIQYGNFKDSVGCPQLHRMYARWWFDHHEIQPRPKTRSIGHADIDKALRLHDDDRWFNFPPDDGDDR